MADENFKGSGLFALDGLTGYFIAVALLLSLLIGLNIWGCHVQKVNQVRYYKVVNAKQIPEFGSPAIAAKHRVYVETVK